MITVIRYRVCQNAQLSKSSSFSMNGDLAPRLLTSNGFLRILNCLCYYFHRSNLCFRVGFVNISSIKLSTVVFYCLSSLKYFSVCKAFDWHPWEHCKSKASFAVAAIKIYINLYHLFWKSPSYFLSYLVLWRSYQLAVWVQLDGIRTQTVKSVKSVIYIRTRLISLATWASA